MRARVSWVAVLAVFLAFPPFQRERVEEMGFGGIFRIERMRADSALTQALRSRWDAEATAFVFPWGHMIPSLEDVSRITALRTYGRPVSGYTYPCYHDLAQRLLELPVQRRSSLVPRVPLQESLGLFDVGKVAGESEDEHLDRLTRVSRRELASEPGAQADLDLRRFLVLFLGRLLFATRGDAVHCRFLPLLEDLAEVGGYAWGAAFLAHQFDSLGASERQTLISGFFPFLQVIWQPYLGEGDEGQPWLVQARPYFGRSVWLHALNLVLPLHLHLSQRSLGLRQSVVEFPVRDHFRRPGRSFRGHHDTTDWRERAKEQISNCEHKGKAVKSTVDVTGEIASLRALLYSAVQDREAAQRQTAELAQLAGAVLRAGEAQRHLEERTTRSERDQLRIRAEAAEKQVAEATKELAALWVQGPPADQAEMVRLHTEVMAQQIRIDELRGMVITLGEAARSRSRSSTGVSGASGGSVKQYLAGSSSRQRNEEDERRHRGEGSAQGDRDGGEMPPPADGQEGSGESGGGHAAAEREGEGGGQGCEGIGLDILRTRSMNKLLEAGRRWGLELCEMLGGALAMALADACRAGRRRLGRHVW
ncbi:hypothetical protein Taro_002492 [Colocasia esculenta]|uniref:Aminotransferase-like plant mobile domain-containing protein n=1 Tax=Colocasia esculenta TaxID=4460 RepID=A0A843TL14_COLES|nr:hypothetical protein [Colocasia esculenta]